MSLSSSPSVSVIVPCYNSEAYIIECVNSISQQSYRNIEIILIDDGSTDKTPVKIEELRRQENRIRSYRIENSGPAMARNYGITHSLGHLIVFVDADDLLLTNAIQGFVNSYFNTRADIVFSYAKKFFIDGREVEDEYVKTLLISNNFNDLDYVKRRMIGMQDKELRHPTKTDAFNTPWAKLYKASLIKENNILFKDRAYIGMEDVLFNIECVLLAKSVSFVSHCTYSYRQINNFSVSRIDTQNLWTKIKNLSAEVIKIPLFKEEYSLAINNRIFLMSINVLLSITNPRVSKSIRQRIQEIRLFVNDPVYQNALSKVQYRYLPTPFKVLYLACRMKMPFIIYLIVLGMRLVRRSNVKNEDN